MKVAPIQQQRGVIETFSKEKCIFRLLAIFSTKNEVFV
jgi:hypothetical protein